MNTKNNNFVAVVTESFDGFEISATATKTGDRTPEGYGWWMARYRVSDTHGQSTAAVLTDGHFISADNALTAALIEARATIQRQIVFNPSAMR